MSQGPGWRQVLFDDVLQGWLAAGGVQEGDKRGRTFHVPVTPEERYRTFVEHSYLFTRFIPACDWFRVVLSRVDEVLALRLIHEESWSHAPVGEERELGRRADLSQLPVAHAERVRQLARCVDVRTLVHERVVLFGHHADGPLTILDGNHRLLALANRLVSRQEPMAPFHAFVGLSHGPCRWHGDPVDWVERPGRTQGERRFILKVW
jgi:hypothetical protein